jgi:alpha-glucoside transport system substrate-binding protein
MLLRRASRILAVGIVLAIFATACSDAEQDSVTVIDVFGPYRGEEAVKFAASIEPFELETGYDVRYVGTGSFAADISARIAEADYPDVAIFPQPALILDAAANGALVRLTDSGTDSGDALEVNTIDSYAVWFRAAAKSLVWYRPPVFEEMGYTVPNTWDELMALSETMVDDGTAPWCMSIESFSSTGWVGTDWIEDIVLREQGADSYDKWVAGDISFESPEIRHAFRTFGSVARGVGTVLGGTTRILSEPWAEAATPMFEDPPRCMMHRQASFWAPNIPDTMVFGEDIDFFILPGVTDTPPPLLVSGELAAAFNDEPEVAALMEFLATPQAGEGWAELGGFISPHEDFDDSHYGSEIDKAVGRIVRDAQVVRFDGSDMMPAVVGTGTFWQAMRVFIRTGDIDRAVSLVDDSWPRISQLPAAVDE